MEVTAREFLERLAALPKPVGMGKVFALAKASMQRSIVHGTLLRADA